ncbi:MAG: LuxR C-terminal-related transcriptional regulator, partial [Bacteroidota bacterium]
PQEEIHLTRREKQVLKMIVKGMTNKEIADQLEKSVRTIETHRFNLMKKLRVKNLAELSLKVKDMGYLLS